MTDDPRRLAQHPNRGRSGPGYLLDRCPDGLYMVNTNDPRSVAAALLGKLGGQSTSAAKRAASAHNGRSSAVRKYPRCESCEEKKRTCYHLVAKEVTK